MKRIHFALAGLGLFIVAGLGAYAAQGLRGGSAARSDRVEMQPPAFPIDRCLNIGNTLEAPREAFWGPDFRLEDLARIRAAGFDGIRLPVRWDNYTGPAPTFVINETRFARVQQVVDSALAADLKVVLDIHHDEPLNAAPEAQRARFIATWRQIAARFRGYPPVLIFEVLNEPNGDTMPAAVTNRLNRDAMAVIRREHPNRLVILTGPRWNTLEALDQVAIPDDPNVAITVHYYDPFDFTHEGASFITPPPTFPRAWGNRSDLETVRADMRKAAEIGASKGVPVLLGEFGVYGGIEIGQRVLWTRAVREAAEDVGLGWCHWDYQAAFPVYDREQERWIAPMVDALTR
jgi:endoglucanase